MYLIPDAIDVKPAFLQTVPGFIALQELVIGKINITVLSNSNNLRIKAD